jgi:hypothetical protein
MGVPSPFQPYAKQLSSHRGGSATPDGSKGHQLRIGSSKTKAETGTTQGRLSSEAVCQPIVADYCFGSARFVTWAKSHHDRVRHSVPAAFFPSLRLVQSKYKVFVLRRLDPWVRVLPPSPEPAVVPRA